MSNQTDRFSYFIALCARPDGREDHDVLSYTVETESIARCFSSDAPLTMLLGMKGVGKSTAFKNMTSKDRDRFLVAGFAPGAERFKRLPNVQPGLFRERFYALFLVGALALARDRDEVSAEERKGISAALGSLRSIIRQIGSAAKAGRSRIKGGSAFGFGLSFDLSEDEEKKLDKFDRDGAKQRLQALSSKGVFIRLFIDDPEQSLPPGEHGKNALIGLVLAANEINVNFKGVVGVTVLLKTHIYHAIADYEELANVLPARRGILSWQQDELLAAVDERLAFAEIDYTDVSSRTKPDLKDEVIRVLRNGPRDLFAWISLAGQSAKRSKLSMDDFTNTKKETGNFSLNQVSTAYTETVPTLRRLIQIIFSRENQEVTLETLIQHVADLRTNNQEFIELTSRNILETSSDYPRFFLDAGLLQLTLHATVVEPFDAKYQEIKGFGSDVKVKLHPLLATAVFG